MNYILNLLAAWLFTPRYLLTNEETVANKKAPLDKHAMLHSLLGVPNDASDDDVAEAYDDVTNQRDALMAADSDGDEDDAPPGPESEMKAKNDAPTPEELAAQIEAAKTEAIANERKERVKLLINAAQKEGRIVPAQVAAWEKKFSDDFDATVIELGNAKPVLKTAALTAGLGSTNAPVIANQESRRAEVTRLVNEVIAKTKCDYATAYHRVSNDPAHAALFGAMEGQALPSKKQ